jgi:two-component system, sensor histidine kinase and response regulator
VVPRQDAAPPAAAAGHRGANHVPHPAGSGKSLAGLKILVIEDHHHTRSATAKLLESEGASVTQAPDGRSGLEMIRSQPPHVLLLDLMLPDLDGREVLAELRESRPPELRHIFVLTGDLVSIDEPSLRAMGVDAVCPKPVDVPCLLQTIAARGAGGEAGGND